MQKVHTKIRNEPASRTGAVTSSSLPDEKKKQTAERDARALARSSSRITDKKTNKNSKKTKNTLPDDKKEKEEQSFFSISLSPSIERTRSREQCTVHCSPWFQDLRKAQADRVTPTL